MTDREKTTLAIVVGVVVVLWWRSGARSAGEPAAVTLPPLPGVTVQPGTPGQTSGNDQVFQTLPPESVLPGVGSPPPSNERTDSVNLHDWLLAKKGQRGGRVVRGTS